MISKLIKDLKTSSQLMTDVSSQLNNLSEENKKLRIILWRMIEKHGTEIGNDKIDNKTLDKIMSANIYLASNFNIIFSNI